MIISVGFSKSKSGKIGSLIIQEVEKRPYSHSYLKYRCPITDKLIVCQASHGLVHELKFERFLEENIEVDVVEISITEAQFRDMFYFIQDKKGTPYGYSHLIWIGIKKLLKIELTESNKDSKMICSEFVMRSLRQINPDFAKEIIHLDLVTPSDLNKLLKEQV